jgi:hypothetical protein
VPYFEAKAGNCETGVRLATHANGRWLITKASNGLIDRIFHERSMFFEWRGCSVRKQAEYANGQECIPTECFANAFYTGY